MEVREVPVVFVSAPGLDRARPSLGAMDAFFSLDRAAEARRRVAFVQQISSSVTGPVAKVQTMPAEPILRPDSDTASLRAAAGVRPDERMAGSAR
jgi:hypothetical protein